MSLQLVWFVLIGLIAAIYAATDGYDLGVGVLYPFLARNDAERGVLRQTIGPVWDGNEVWLLVFGGALFGTFPVAYAVALSAFYLAIMLVLFGLILRAVSLEFRSHSSGALGLLWDTAFFVGSLLPALLFGVAVGDVVRGVKLGPSVAGQPGNYAGSFFSLLHPYALLVGVTGLTAFVLMGATWAAFKSDGELQARAARAASWAQALLVALFVLTTVYTALDSSAKAQLSDGLGRAAGWVALAVLVAGLAYGRWAMLAKNDGRAFLGAMVTVLGLVAVGGAGLYPNLTRALTTPGSVAVTTHNASASHLTLTVMLVFAVVALPVVIAYQVYVHRLFSGRVRSEDVEY